MYISALVIVVLLITNYIFPFIVNRIMKRNFKKKLSLNNNIFITFDDGPDELITPIILDVLSEKKVKATFFMVGEKIEKNRALVDLIIKSGHEIGEHSYFHYHPWKLNIFRYVLDLYKSHKIFKELYSNNAYEIKLYRPPYGKFNILTLIYLIVTKKTPIFWNLDVQDYDAVNKEEIINKVNLEISKGKVLLLHYGNPDENIKNIPTSLAIKDIINEIYSRNLEIKTINTLYE